MASKQETGVGYDYQEYAWDADAAETELRVEPYCRITIERTRPDGTREVLHTYDMPRETMWDWQWVYEWRKARYVCMYPRDNVQMYFGFYDRKTGLAYDMDSLRSRQVAAKALVTKYTRNLERYLESQRGQLFFDPEADVVICKMKDKIASARNRLDELTRELESHITPQTEQRQ